MEICPYMGSVWDLETPYTVPDSANRCFARSEPVRVFLLFRREVFGTCVEINDQRTDCYGDFRQCGDFTARETAQKTARVAARSEQ